MNIREYINKAPNIGEVYDLVHDKGGTIRIVVTDIEGIYAKVKVLEMNNLKDITVRKLREDEKQGFKMELKKFIEPDPQFKVIKVEHEWAKTLYGR